MTFDPNLTQRVKANGHIEAARGQGVTGILTDSDVPAGACIEYLQRP